MSAPTAGKPPVTRTSDRLDERLQDRAGFRGAVQTSMDRLRSGDLGTLPVVAGLVVIFTVMYFLNDNFLSPRNLVNLTLQMSDTGVIALGIVLVLLIIFVTQNTDPTTVRFLVWESDIPVAVALLIAAVAGLFLAGIAASMRILQLRRRVKHDRKA